MRQGSRRFSYRGEEPVGHGRMEGGMRAIVVAIAIALLTVPSFGQGMGGGKGGRASAPPRGKKGRPGEKEGGGEGIQGRHRPDSGVRQKIRSVGFRASAGQMMRLQHRCASPPENYAALTSIPFTPRMRPPPLPIVPHDGERVGVRGRRQHRRRGRSSPAAATNAPPKALTCPAPHPNPLPTA